MNPLKDIRITFNVPHLTGKEVHYIYDAVFNKQLSGNGKYTKLCHQFFKINTAFIKSFLLPLAPILWKCVLYSLIFNPVMKS